ncbi:MAG: DUF3500 domain-containing protein [Luteitalea sp.]|nr:DUF3500 domain-containing protein [Luteitalea sp.]
MATAADQFLEELAPDERQRASFPFDGDERTRWNFIPTEQFPRQGLPIKDMTEPQRKRAHTLLEAGLSARGYLTATAIMDLETVLKAIERRGRISRDPELYFFTVFGTPSPDDAWGWRVEGHHVSLHFTIVNGTAIASSPLFFGSNPGEVREGPKKGLRVLAVEEDTARELLMALDESQRATAVIADVAPREIVTKNAAEADPLSPVGITASAMTPAQRDLLMEIIDAYTSHMADDIRSDRMTKLREAGIEKIAFAWSGESELGKKHYYRVQGPTFLIEYDNTQNDGNHIHSVWRDFDGDFGHDLLREHLAAVRH